MKKFKSKKTENKSTVAEKDNTIIKDEVNDKPWKYVFVVLAAIIGICMVCVAFSAGSGGDDIFDGYHGKLSLEYYKTHDPSYVEVDGHDMELFSHMKYYGSGFEMLPALVVKAFNIPEHELLIRRLLIGLFGFLLIIITGLTAKNIKDWKLATITILMMALTPTLFGLSFIASKDIPFALGFAIATYGMIRFCKNLPKVSPIDCVLIMGGILMSVSVRIGGLLLFLYFAVIFCITFAFNDKLRKYIVTDTWSFVKIIGLCIGICFSGALLGLLFYPNFFHEGPIKHVVNAFGVVSNFPQVIPYIFDGKMYSSVEVPEHYLLRSFSITLPIFILAGLVLFVIFLFRYKDMGNQVLFLSFMAIFPIAYISLTHANIYNGWRHITFSYPSIAMLSSIGWYMFSEQFKKFKYFKFVPYVLFMAGIAPVLVWMISNPRYTYSYYNEFVPNPYLKYELDYFETSATETYDWFRKNELPKCDSVVTMSTKIQTPTYYAQMLHDTNRVKVFTTSYMGFAETDCDYSIINYHIIQPKAIKKFFPPKGTIHVEYVDGNPVCALVKRNKLDSKGIKLCKQGKYAEAVTLLDSAYNYDPNNFGIWFWLGLAHFQTRDFEKSMEFFDKDLNFMATNEKYAMVTMYNGASLYELKRYDEAIKTLQEAERRCIDKQNLPFIHAHLGLAYFAKEEYANALPYLQSAVSAYPFLAGQINYCNLHR